MVELSDLEFIKLTGVISSVFKSVNFGEKVEVSLSINLWRLKELSL